MASEIGICNMALSLLGQKPILNLLNPTNATEQLCALYYEPVRDAVIEAHNWTFAVSRDTLSAPLATPPDWGFSAAFALPTDCLRVIWAGRQTDESVYDRFDWRVEEGRLLASEVIIYIRYIQRVTDPSKYSPLFVQALATRLALEMCIAVTENVGLYERLTQQYALKVGEAAANNGMQGRSQTIKQEALVKAR